MSETFAFMKGGLRAIGGRGGNIVWKLTRKPIPRGPLMMSYSLLDQTLPEGDLTWNFCLQRPKRFPSHLIQRELGGFRDMQCSLNVEVPF